MNEKVLLMHEEEYVTDAVQEGFEKRSSLRLLSYSAGSANRKRLQQDHLLTQLLAAGTLTRVR